jgi:hypothetical protein
MKPIRRHIKTPFAIWLFLLFGYVLIMAVGLSHATSSETPTTTIYFYSSESNINNFRSLKIEFDRYLSRFGKYSFQPFKTRAAFEGYTQNRKDGALLISSWHYSMLSKTVDLQPVLLGTRKGKKKQKRLLVSLERAAGWKIILQGLASASSNGHTQDFLNKMFPNEKSLAQTVKILAVPKDIDALMSVGFGVSKAALTTENAFSRLKMVNPSLHGRMAVLAESPEAYLPIIALPDNCDGNVHQLLKVIADMPKHPEGMKNIKMLGFDAWQPVTLADRQIIENKHYTNALRDP